VIGRNRVVITGIGVLAANGIGKDAFWNSLLAGESGIGPVTRCNVDDLPSKIAGEVKDFHPERYLDGKIKPKRISRQTQLAVAAA
jgi:3-oxoacyl-[acyl-carrier-protein] synthase II